MLPVLAAQVRTSDPHAKWYAELVSPLLIPFLLNALKQGPRRGRARCLGRQLYCHTCVVVSSPFLKGDMLSIVFNFFLCLVLRPFPLVCSFSLLKVTVWNNLCFRERTFVVGGRCWSLFFGLVSPRVFVLHFGSSLSKLCGKLSSCQVFCFGFILSLFFRRRRFSFFWKRDSQV